MSSNHHYAGDGNTFDPETIWIYHERQEALLCGQHALNNLVQSDSFSAMELATIAQQLDALELQFMADNNEGGMNSPDYRRRFLEGSHHVDAQGNFSIEVLKAAIQNMYGISLPHLSQKDLLSGKQDITEYQGFLCHKSDHWFAIRKIGGRFWNLNSMLERPTVMSHFTLGKEMNTCHKEGYTIFCVPSGLPACGIKPMNSRNTANHLWHKMSDLLVGKSTTDSTKNPWENVGSGIRLDGGSTRNPSSSSHTDGKTDNFIEELTEDEQLRLALAYSLEPTQTDSMLSDTTNQPVAVPSEPDMNSPGVVKIQFRFPPGFEKSAIIRRFDETNTIHVIYAFVQQLCKDQQKEYTKLELRCGYPPKDLHSYRNQTIGEARLANECIQCRLI
jgi:Ataxin-3